MRMYIGTVYHLSSSAAVVDGNEGITRKIVRRLAKDEEHFKALCKDGYGWDVDAEFDFGPISLSKDQG